MRGAPSKRTAAAARPRLCEGSIGGTICVATLIKRTLPPLSTHHPPVTPLISPSLPTAQGLAQAEKPKPAWSGPSQPKGLHGRGDGEATSIRSSCAPARCLAHKSRPAARYGSRYRPSSPRSWSLKQHLPRSSASAPARKGRRTRAGQKVRNAEVLGGWRGVSRLSVAHASTIPKEKLEGQEIVEYAMRLTLAIPGVRPPGW